MAARELRCEHRGCTSTHAEPQITKSFSKMKAGEHQPEWFCAQHAPYHPLATFWGEVIRPAKREVKRGKTQSRR